MLKTILGSLSSERTLIFILARDAGYGAEIARFYGTAVNAIQQQLEKFENGEVLVSQNVGRTVVYSFNPRYPFVKPLKELLTQALSFYPQEEQDRLQIYRRRPRR